MKPKIIIALVAMSLLAFGNQNKKPKNDLEKMNLKGKVKSLKEFGFKIDENLDGIIKIDSTRFDTYSFNDKGSIIEVIMCINSNVFSKLIYKYDNEGNKIEKNVESHGDLFLKWIYKYDKNRNKIIEYEYECNSNRLHRKIVYKYDDNQIKESVCTKPNGRLDWKTTYKYDDRRNKIEMNDYYAKSKLIGKLTYIHDSEGNEIEINNYISDNQLIDKKILKYDEKKNIIEENWYDFKSGNLLDRITLKYNYDKQGNWIKKTLFRNDEPMEIIEREIEYYN